MYVALLAATALLCGGAIVAGAWYYRDTLHPMVYLGALLAAIYVLSPAYLLNEGDLSTFLSDEQLVDVHILCLVGVAFMLAGVWRGAGRRIDARVSPAAVLPRQQKALVVGAILLGAVAVGGFSSGIANVGGFGAAYGRGYGGGWDDSGYLRDLFLFSVPALLWLMIAYRNRHASWLVWCLVLVVASPLLVQGVLGARRGPTFMALVGLTVGWYLMHGRRPRLTTLLGGGALLGFAMLFLVANRQAIHLGSDMNETQDPLGYLRASTSNEYIYGGAVILHARAQDDYYWGGRLFQSFLVRPIPRSLWPAKYQETSEWLGVPSVETGNNGLPITELRATVGWVSAPGAAPGIVADVWIEFWWFGMAWLYGLGWIYGRVWRKARLVGGPWIPCFGILTALSVYMVMQSVEAVGFRALFMLAGSTAIWWGSKLRQGPVPAIGALARG